MLLELPTLETASFWLSTRLTHIGRNLFFYVALLDFSNVNEPNVSNYDSESFHFRL